MTAVDRVLEIEQGATFTLGFTWCRAGADASTPGTPYDLTGWSARMQIRRKPGAPLLLEDDSAATADPQEEVVSMVAADIRWPARNAPLACARHQRRVPADRQSPESMHGHARAEAGFADGLRFGMRIIAAGCMVPAFKTIAGVDSIVSIHAGLLETG